MARTGVVGEWVSLLFVAQLLAPTLSPIASKLQLAKNRSWGGLGAVETEAEQDRKSLDSSFPYGKYLTLTTVCLG